MDSSEPQRSLPQAPPKAKEIYKPSSPDVPAPANRAPWIFKTPEKPLDPPRPRRGRVALSISDVRRFAQGLRESGHIQSQTGDEIGAGGSQISNPRKNIKSLASKSNKVDRQNKLPQKYEELCEFFDNFLNSIRLLRMKGCMTTFTNISNTVVEFAGRRFFHGHMAQLKFILPEAIELSKVLVLDEQTSCMKPDLRVKLNVDAIEYEEGVKSHLVYLYLSKEFRSRLLAFHKAHPEGDDVPKETLPAPFNKLKRDECLNRTILRSSHPPETSSDSQLELQPGVASHNPRSFSRKFSKRLSGTEAAKIHQKLTNASLDCSSPTLPDCHDEKLESEHTISSVTPSKLRLTSKSATTTRSVAFGVSPSYLPQSPLAPPTPREEMVLPHSPLRVNPCKVMASTSNADCSTKQADDNVQATPVKLMSSPTKLMTTTPAMQPPKRLCVSPDDCPTSEPNKLVRRALRPLIFDSPTKDSKAKAKANDEEKPTRRGLSLDDDTLDVLPASLVQSLREREEKILKERDPAISQAKKRQYTISRLPKLFNMIHFFFQSIKRSTVTKEELLHNILATHCDIVDRGEIEDQLKLLLEVVPEWITEKLALSGDCLIRVNKGCSPDSVRSRIAELHQ